MRQAAVIDFTPVGEFAQAAVLRTRLAELNHPRRGPEVLLLIPGFRARLVPAEIAVFQHLQGLGDGARETVSRTGASMDEIGGRAEIGDEYAIGVLAEVGIGRGAGYFRQKIHLTLIRRRPR